MKILKKRLFLSILFFCFLVLCHSKEVVKVEKKLPYSKGVNLSSWLEPQNGFIDGSFYNYGRQDFVDLKNLGVEVVRVPVHFDTLSMGKPDYIIPESLWKCLDGAVDWCEELDLYLIIDFHNDCGGNSRTPADIEKRLLKIWPQIAQRYKNRSSHVIYEIMNEPHGIDEKKWGRIQGNVIKKIRSIDSVHSIVAGAADWNSVHALLNLPEYDDDNLIYNFHEYSPFLFTHQGAEWTDVGRLTGIPFPYDENKMPPLPKNATEAEKHNMREYEKASSEKVLIAPLDKAVEFVNKRHAALMSNEFGVYMKYADPQERVNWYRIKSGYLDERNIVRVSWDYRGGFGIFSKSRTGVFPQDVDVQIVEAMGYRNPSSAAASSWYEDAAKSGKYEIYKNGLAPKLLFFGWIPEAGNSCSLNKTDSDSKESFIDVPKSGKYRELEFNFNENVDFTKLKEKGASLEFEICVKDAECGINVYFKDSDKDDVPWRAGIFLSGMKLNCNGKWQKVSVPLSDFTDYGAWDEKNNRWENPRNKFSWKKVSCLVFDTAGSEYKKGFAIKNIEIK